MSKGADREVNSQQNQAPNSHSAAPSNAWRSRLVASGVPAEQRWEREVLRKEQWRGTQKVKGVSFCEDRATHGVAV